MLTVKELIKRCDKERLTAEYIKLIDLPIEKYDRFKVYFGAFIDQLIDKEYIVSDNDIVINADCFSLDMENHYVDSSVYYIDEIKRYFVDVDFFDELDSRSIEALSDSETETLFKKYSEFLDKRKKNDTQEETIDIYEWPQSYAYEFTQWNEILGYLIPNHVIGSDEECSYAASIIYEMTFFGFDESEQIKEREKLDESIKEAKEIEKLQKEEQEKYFIPADKVFEELGYVDERTEEEKERDKMINRKSIVLSALLAYRVLRQVYNELE